jgi:DNA polymerase III delta prime subunit
MLLSEYLRPKSFDEICISPDNRDKLNYMYENGYVMNMLFYGKPGTGKTSSGMIFCNDLDKYDSLIINGSLDTGIDEVRKKVSRFSSTISLYGTQKIVFIDESDYLSPSSQSSLRKIIEDSSENCRFIFSCNEIKKIQSPLQSRLMLINFDVTQSVIKDSLVNYRNRTIQKLIERYGDNQVDIERINYIINYYYPDYRTIANQLEYEMLMSCPDC